MVKFHSVIIELALISLQSVGIKNISIELSSCEFLNFLINNVNNNNFREKIMFFTFVHEN